MNIIQIFDVTNFEPTRSTKGWWSFTHKRAVPKQIAGVDLPGLCDISLYEWQAVGFMAIFLLEGLATYFAYWQGVIITAILSSVFVDLVFAIAAHCFHANICNQKNICVFNDLPANRRKLRRLKSKQRLFYVLILLSAAFKVHWFFSVYAIFDSTTVFISLCYIIGGVLHISCTGFFLFTSYFLLLAHLEYDKHEQSNFKKHVGITSKIQLGEGPFILCASGKHKISKDPSGHCGLEAEGILTDGALLNLIAQQTNEAEKATVAKKGVELQLSILNR